MKFILSMLFLFPLATKAALIEFSPNTSIKTNEINHNFNEIKLKLNERHVNLDFRTFNYGELIRLNDIESEFDKVRNLGIDVSLIDNLIIESDELNTRFNQMYSGAKTSLNPLYM